MSELPQQLRQLADFYAAAFSAPSDKSYAIAPGLIDQPDFFTLQHLERHLNNPL